MQSAYNSIFLEKYKKLNEHQKLAVDTTEGALLVVAGPGSGKTELLSLRVANILQKNDVYPSNILCLTFTDAAAKNMGDRLSALIGVDAHRVAIHTFHSFALNVKNRFQENFYEFQEINAADELVQIETISKILATLPLSDALNKRDETGSYFYLHSIKDRISKLKKAGITPEQYKAILHSNATSYAKIEKIIIPIFEERVSKNIRDELPKLIEQLNEIKTPGIPLEHSSLLDYKDLLIQSLSAAHKSSLKENATKPITFWKNEWLKKDPDTKELRLKDAYQLERNISLADVYQLYQENMRASGYVDFDDMIMDLLRVLRTKKGVLSQLQEQYQYILVDEFQDTNDAQMRIINMLTDNSVHENNPNIMVVGDDDQAVYKFQGGRNK
jgi:DNA helicase-2/ATP-dependent DNA helicase PcrA